MSVSIEHDESTNVYNLVGEVDGVGIVFATVPGDTVTARIAAVQAEADEAAGGNGSGGRSQSSPGGSTINADDYTANDDGSYTRKSDGQVGRFTPAGFEPTQGS